MDTLYLACYLAQRIHALNYLYGMDWHVGDNVLCGLRKAYGWGSFSTMHHVQGKDITKCMMDSYINGFIDCFDPYDLKHKR